MTRLILTVWITLSFALPVYGQSYSVFSPDGSIEAHISTQPSLTFSVRYQGETVIHSSNIGLEIRGVQDAITASVEVRQRTVDETITPVVKEKRAVIPDRYNEITLSSGGQLAVTFRAYDDGVAYRFETAFPDSITVDSEQLDLTFSNHDSLYIPIVTCREEVDCFHSSFEENYQHVPVSGVPDSARAFLPVLVRTPAGPVAFTESDLRDYPGLWVTGTGDRPALIGTHAGYPLEEKVFGGEFKQRLVTRRADFIARSAGTRTYPWRVMMIAEQDKDLIENDLVYRLAGPLELEDVSWIQPGIATDEWITSRLLYDVDFVSGLNTETYRYYIDFAADYGLEYMMFDAGWSSNEDLTQINPDIDLPGLIEYARSKGVGIFLWNLALTFERQMEEVLDQYQRWGIRGIMVDFMDRDDQKMLQFYERVAREAAEHRLLVNFHGAFKPTGLQRAFPNLITREGVLGHEFNMWSDRVTPDHILTIPFVRMTAGPLDYEGGCMNNGTREDFRVVFQRPMCQGTRTQQMAQYLVYESPLQYLAGTPSDYRREPEFTRILADIPTTWDETIALEGKTGDYLLLARRHGEVWYLAALTDWSPRDFEIALSFLPDRTYEATIVQDGLNADRYAGDYKIRTEQVRNDTLLEASLASGGGWVAVLRPR